MLRAKIILLLLIIPFGLSYGAAVAKAAPMEEEISIVVDKSSHTLSVYVNEDPVYTFPVATGRGDLTPEGEFYIANKIKNPWYIRKNIRGGDKRNPFGTRWLGINVPNTGGYRYGVHGTNAPYSIGSSASSGCIRMLNKDVEWLYAHIPIGTKIIIRE